MFECLKFKCVYARLNFNGSAQPLLNVYSNSNNMTSVSAYIASGISNKLIFKTITATHMYVQYKLMAPVMHSKELGNMLLLL